MTFTPAKFVVYCTVRSTPKNKLDKSYTHRVGSAHDLNGVKIIIERDFREFNKGFGHVFDLADASSSNDRTYHAFEAEWSELDVPRIMNEPNEPVT